ncbi:MAG: DUF1491 family protein [Alphaproteobacteria bacterium]
MDEDLPTALWIQLHLRQADLAAIPAVVVRKGDPHRGTILLKLAQRPSGWRILGQVRDGNGDHAWLAALHGTVVEEPDADAYITKAVARDGDLWVIEIDDRDGRNPFPGKIL